jgi:hypothetical protein
MSYTYIALVVCFGYSVFPILIGYIEIDDSVHIVQISMLPLHMVYVSIALTLASVYPCFLCVSMLFFGLVPL